MSKVYKNGFDAAFAGNGLTGGNQIYKRGISINNTSNPPFSWTIGTTQNSNNNPYTTSAANWGTDGSRVDYGSFWGQWIILNGSQIGSLGIKIKNTITNSEVKFLEITGNQLPSQEDAGTEVTLGFNSSKGKLDVIRPGIAEAIVNGLQNVSLYYVLLDGSGTVKDSKQASNAGGPTGNVVWTYDSDLSNGKPGFRIGSNLEITNSTGGQYTIEDVQVRTGSPTGKTFMKDPTISKGFPSGAVITFNTLESVISGLS